MSDVPDKMYKYGDKRTWELAVDAVQQLGGSATLSELRAHLIATVQGYNEKNLSADLSAVSVNSTSRIHFGGNKSPRRTDAGDKQDRLYKQGSGREARYELYEPGKHGVWKIYNNAEGNLQVDQVGMAPATSPVPATPSLISDPPLMRDAPLNQILFGPPGTGKTYQTIEKSLEILDPTLVSGLAEEEAGSRRKALKARFDELVSAERIRFVTFHQSFSYEDFVEGLRAENDDDGQLQYRVEPGVFKSICDAARGAGQVASAVGIRDGARLWKVSIDGTGTSPTREYCFAHDEARIGWGDVGDLRETDVVDRSAYAKLGSHDRNTLQAFSSEMQPGDVVLCIGSATTVQGIGVVQGDYNYDASPPTAVRTDYRNILPVHWLATELTLDLRSLNAGKKFTLKTVYELTRFSWSELANVIAIAGIELKGVAPAQQRQPLDHVLIIDEINRGNVSRIFGELITLIETSKREGADEQLQALLPYSKKSFAVPKNVYLIGTMNTADRSLAGLDIALRRRFEFVEMPPRPDLLAGIHVESIDIEALLTAMNQRIEVLLDRDHQLGHAYFLPLRAEPTLARLATIFRNQIVPLLQEYFFEDWQRIAWVLNDHRKDKDFCFVVPPKLDVNELFGTAVEVPIDTKLWQLYPDAFDRIDSYRGICSPMAGA